MGRTVMVDPAGVGRYLNTSSIHSSMTPEEYKVLERLFRRLEKAARGVFDELVSEDFPSPRVFLSLRVGEFEAYEKTALFELKREVG